LILICALFVVGHFYEHCPNNETILVSVSFFVIVHIHVTNDLLEESYLANAAEVGQYALDVLQVIQVWHPSIGDVRGKGLMISVEFVKDKATKEPNEKIRNMIENTGFEHDLLLLGCGKSTIRLAPPLCITKGDVDEALEIFEGAISMTEEKQDLLEQNSV